MDRPIVYPGAIPLETDILNTNKTTMVGLSKLTAAVLGTTTLVNGLACTPTGPASLQVYVAPGEIYSLQNIDATAYSSLAADTVHNIVKQGILLDQATLSCPPPGTAGQSINYLIEAAYLDSDTGSAVLPYYNSSNPAVAYSGPANSGTAQNTSRKGVCNVQVKAGIAAATGSQTTPAADAGYTGIWVVTVANGQTQITAPNIVQVVGAPFITETLTQKISQTTGDARYAQLVSPAFTGTPTAPTASVGTNTTQIATTAFVTASSSTGVSNRTVTNLSFSAVPTSNAMVITLLAADGTALSSTNSAKIGFRSATLTSGVVNLRTITAAIATTISSGSTGGTVSGKASRIWVGAIDNAGTVELAWYNALTGTSIAPINESGVITTVAEGGAGAAVSAQVWYSTTARTNVPVTVLGYFESTQTTAGTWAAAVTNLIVNPKYRPGDIVQTQEVIKTDTFTTASATFTDITGIAVSITPTSAANPVRVSTFVNVNTSGVTSCAFLLVRGSTGIGVGDLAGLRLQSTFNVANVNSSHISMGAYSMIDKPSSNASTTYKLQMCIAGSTAYINLTNVNANDANSYSARPSSIINVQEIMA